MDARRILGKLILLEVDLGGDVTRLTEFRPEYRLRVGDYRVLFDLEGDSVVVRRVLHRSKAYER
jgi:mRNA interferase RelE/StbE